MRHLRILIVNLLLGVFLLSALCMAPARTASAAGCSGHGCDGKDAVAMGCASGSYSARTATRTVPAPSFGGSVTFTVVSQYSPNCGTNWARAYINNNTTNRRAFEMVVWLERESDPGTLEEEKSINGTWYPRTDTSIYGAMYYAPVEHVRAVLFVYDPRYKFWTFFG